MRSNTQPFLYRTERFMRLLGYSERSIREITKASKREIFRCRELNTHFFTENDSGKSKGGGGAPNML